MNTTAPPPENGQYPTNQSRPFFYAQPTAQLPFQNPWYLGQLYNPYCVPGPGFRGGNPYFPYYSVALHEYPGYFVPQPQMNTRMSRRPHFNPHPPSPMFYHATRFRHYSSPGRRTETKETQTDPRQQECASKIQLNSDSKGCDGGNLVYHSSGISSTGNDSNLENVEMSMSPATSAQERDFHKNACNSAQYRNMPPGSYAYEKEEVRIEYGSGSPAAIQMWKSYKETIPIYDVAVVKELPENVVQRDLFCEGVLYGPHAEGEEHAVQSVAFSNKDECKNSLPPKLCINTVQETETQTTIVQTRDPRYETSKQGKQGTKVNTTVEAESPTMVMEHVEVVSPVYDDPQVSVPEDSNEHNLITNGDLREGSDGCPEQQGIPNQSTCNGEVKLANKSNMWTDDSIEKFMPSPTWLACFENIDANYDYDVYSSQRKQKRPSVLSITSEELSSRDEGSSLDSASVSYFVPDYILRKGLYTFRKTTEDFAKETIKSSGSLKEDDKPLKQSCNKYEKKYRSSAVKAKDVSSRCRKIGVPLKGLSRRKNYSVKKKTKKSQSLSEPEDSEEYWVMEEENLQNYEEGDDEEDSEEEEEEEYYFQESLPPGQVDIGKGSIFKQIAQKRILWKPPKGMIPAQLVGWPVRDKLVTKKGAYDTLNPVCRFKDYDGSDYTIYDPQIEKLNRGFITEPKKLLQKSVGGKAQKKTPGAAVEEYWVGRGAKPKFPEPAYYLQDPAKIKKQDKPPKKKGALKSTKRKQTRTDPEEVETWEVPRSFLYRGHGLRRCSTKKK